MKAGATWFRRCGWGVFGHYLTGRETPAEQWSRQVDAFFSLDDDLVVARFNPAAERLFHRRSAAVCGKHLSDAFPESKGSVLDKKCRQAVKESASLSFQAHLAALGRRYDVRVFPHAEGVSILLQGAPGGTREPAPGGDKRLEEPPRRP